MSLINLIVALVVVGVILYLINAFIPMDEKIKKILNIAVIIVLVLWLLKVLGLFGAVSNIRV